MFAPSFSVAYDTGAIVSEPTPQETRTMDQSEEVSSSVALRRDAACLRFEAAWKAGQRPDPAVYLSGVDEPERALLRRELEALELQAWLAWGSLPLLLPLSLLLEDGQVASLRSADVTGWSALVYSAVLASLVAHTAYFALIRRYPVSSVAPVTVLTPLFSVLFSVLFLSDVLDGRMIVGGVLTLGGITVILVRERRGAALRT